MWEIEYATVQGVFVVGGFLTEASAIAFTQRMRRNGLFHVIEVRQTP